MSDDGLWLSLAEIARARGVSKQAISKRVRRFEEQGLLSTRTTPQGAKLVNLAQFDQLTRETTDLRRAANGTTRRRLPGAEAGSSPFIFTHEQARKAAYDADLKRLELGLRTGELVLIDDLQQVLMSAVESIVRKIDQLPTRAEESAALIGTDGLDGARRFLDQVKQDLEAAIRKELSPAVLLPERSAMDEDKDTAPRLLH